jgi:hypothetical protein
MSFEDDINELNKQYFFREFTYSRTQFRPHGGTQLELADSLILVGSTLVAFQLKAREAKTADAESEAKWFNAKVLKQGTRQIRDTLRYLEDHQPLELANHRGHKQTLAPTNIQNIHKVICYDPAAALTSTERDLRFYRSSTAGLIHLLPASDYLGLVRTLLTPAELLDYLSFRAELIDTWSERIVGLPEQALVGHYLAGNAAAEPGVAHIEALSRLEHRADRWDISGIVAKFADRIVSPEQGTQYYAIVTELAKLNRNELTEFKTRYLLTREKAKGTEMVRPFLMMCPRTGCAFVFIPIPVSASSHRQDALWNFTLAAKYQFRASRCIGVTMTPEENRWWATDWCYIEGTWAPDDALDAFLKKHPFRHVKEVELPRYAIRK